MGNNPPNNFITLTKITFYFGIIGFMSQNTEGVSFCGVAAKSR
jgi:hypothetical protein